jgi:hypothetical protein
MSSVRFETQVSKADSGIKKILSAIKQSDGYEWRGRKVSVVQVDPSFTYHLYNDTGEPHVFKVSGLGNRIAASRFPRPSYGGLATLIEAPSHGEAVVVRQIGSMGSIAIYVPELDASSLDVARDAWLSGDKRAAKEVLRGLGPYAGIGEAIISSQGGTLEKVTSGKTSRQLDREIAGFLRSKP